jgi:hypothetical protein
LFPKVQTEKFQTQKKLKNYHKKIKEKEQKKNGSTTKHPQMIASKKIPTVVILGYLTPLTSSINIKTFITTSKKFQSSRLRMASTSSPIGHNLASNSNHLNTTRTRYLTLLSHM